MTCLPSVMEEGGTEPVETRTPLLSDSAGSPNQPTKDDETLLGHQEQGQESQEAEQSENTIKPSTDAGGSSKKGRWGAEHS